MAHYTSVKYSNPSETFFLSRRIVVGHESMGKSHFHTNYEIFYLLSGERLYFIKDRSYVIKKGNIVFIKPHEIHTVSDTGIPDHERILIKFNREFILGGTSQDLEAFDLLFNKYHCIALHPTFQRVIDNIFDKMQQEAENQSMDFELCLRSLLIQLLIYTARNINLVEKLPYINSTHARISEIVKYINENYQRKLTLTGIAKAFHISPYYLSRIFKEVTNMTFIDYLNNLRVLSAQKLLRDSELSVMAVANEVGFENQSYFGRTFKSIIGISPLQYRKRGLW